MKYIHQHIQQQVLTYILNSCVYFNSQMHFKQLCSLFLILTSKCITENFLKLRAKWVNVSHKELAGKAFTNFLQNFTCSSYELVQRPYNCQVHLLSRMAHKQKTLRKTRWAELHYCQVPFESTCLAASCCCRGSTHLPTSKSMARGELHPTDISKETPIQRLQATKTKLRAPCTRKTPASLKLG